MNILKVLILSFIFVACSSNRTEPKEFCEDVVKSLCSVISDCYSESYDECVHTMSLNMSCTSWDDSLVCGNKKFNSKGAENCAASTINISCQDANTVDLPLACHNRFICR